MPPPSPESGSDPVRERSGEAPSSHRAWIRLSARDRFAAWLVTGPVGRVVAFAIDLATAWWAWALGGLRSKRTR